MTPRKTAIIIGAGPAGLTAAYELLTRTDIVPIILEKSEQLGGISKTINYKGNRIDIGGHRFFSKSDRVMTWWLRMLPLQIPTAVSLDAIEDDRQSTLPLGSQVTNPIHRVMLQRQRKSRIYYNRRFFDYPIRLTLNTVKKLGFLPMLRIAVSYMWRKIFPIRQENSLEEFLINRFGGELYQTFFKSYTEKVWGVPCSQISAAWGAQRIKGLSIIKAVCHAISASRKSGIYQKKTETSLIEQFLYPRFGPGQMWETVAEKIRHKGGLVLTTHEVTHIRVRHGLVCDIEAKDMHTGETVVFSGDYFFSTMPVKELIRSLDCPVPSPLLEINDGLAYRNFITVGLVVNRFKLTDKNGSLIKDNWIYIQEKDVKLGRLQIFNNWSPYMTAIPGTILLGLEYFCDENDDLWNLSDDAMVRLATVELQRLDMIDSQNVLDAVVVRVPQAYPAYFGTFNRFANLRAFLDDLSNLYLIGRNGMHRYNNQDHSMLTAMVAVDNIINNKKTKEDIWNVNAEDDYHEKK